MRCVCGGSIRDVYGIIRDVYGIIRDVCGSPQASQRALLVLGALVVGLVDDFEALLQRDLVLFQHHTHLRTHRVLIEP